MARSRPVVPPQRTVDPLHALRNFVQTSPWLAIAIAAHVIVGAIFAIVNLSKERPPEERSVLVVMPTRAAFDLPPLPEPEDDFFEREIPDNVKAELVAPGLEAFVDPYAEPPDFHDEIGAPNPDGNPDEPPGSGPPGAPGATSIGVGGPGHHGLGPSPWVSRTLGPGGDGREPGNGRTRQPQKVQVIDEAILDGLLWLARHQDESGRWSGATCAQVCPEESPCQPETALEAGLYSTQADVGLTALALLSFLGAGFTQNSEQFFVDSRAGREITVGKEVVLPGLKWLVDQQRPDGSFSEGGTFFLYNEALAALALSEAYGLTHHPYWRKPAQRAVDFICRAQKPSPLEKGQLWGWRYVPAEAARESAALGSTLSESDVSVTGWMVMALKSAEMAGLKVPPASIQGALDFIRWSTGENGLVGYLGPDSAGDPIVGEHDEFVYHPGTMSSIAMCVRIFLEHDRDDPFLPQAADVLLHDLPRVGDPDAPLVDYYYWYYGSLALNQIDGPDAPRRTNAYWGPWNEAMNDTILAMQDHTRGACSHGGWMRPDRWSYGYGPVYTTAINVLTLEVYYRYPNAFGLKPSSAADAGRRAAPSAEGDAK